MDDIYEELWRTVSKYLAENPGADRELAREFETALFVVRKWAENARPYPFLAEMIIAYIKNRSTAG